MADNALDFVLEAIGTAGQTLDATTRPDQFLAPVPGAEHLPPALRGALSLLRGVRAGGALGGAMGETGAGLAFPRGFATQAPLPRDQGYLGLPPSAIQQIAAEGAFSPIEGLQRAAGYAQEPIPRLGPPAEDTYAGTTGSWQRAPAADPFEAARYAIERTRSTYEHAPEAFPGQKFVAAQVGNPLTYVGWGGPEALAARTSNPALKSALEAAAAGERGFTQGVGDTLGGVGQGLARLPGVRTAVERTKQAGVAIAKDDFAALRGLFEADPTGKTTDLFNWLAARPAQMTGAEAEAGLAGASALVRSHGLAQAEQDRKLIGKAYSVLGQLRPSVTEPMDIAATRAALEARAGITAADTQALLDQALPLVAKPNRDFWTSADIGKAVGQVQTEGLSAGGVPVEMSMLRSQQYDDPLKAAQLAWLQERYGDVYPGTIGANMPLAAVAARVARQGEAASGAAAAPAVETVAPVAPAGGAGNRTPAEIEEMLVRSGVNPAMAREAAYAQAAPVAPPAAAEPAAGIPLGRASVDPPKVQEGLDLGLSRTEAIDRARGINLSGTPVEPAPPPPPRPGASSAEAVPVTPSPPAPASPSVPIEPAAFSPQETSVLQDIAAMRTAGDPVLPSHAALERTILGERVNPFDSLAGARTPAGLPPPTSPAPAEASFPSAAGPVAEARAGPLDPGGPTGLLPDPAPPTPPEGGVSLPSAPAASSEAPPGSQALLAQQREQFLRMNPGKPGFNQQLVDAAPDLVARYDAALPEAQQLQAAVGGGKTLREIADSGAPEAAKARRLLGDFGGTDLLQDAKTDVLQNTWMADYMKARGIEIQDPNQLQRAAHEVIQLWRQQALFAPAFLVRNQIDASLRMLVYAGNLGIDHSLNPLGAKDPNSFWQIFQRAGTRADQLTPDRTPWLGAGMKFLEEATGAPIPPAVLQGQTQSLLEARRGFERLPGVAGKAFRGFRELYTAMEQSMRATAYEQAYRAAAPKALPGLRAGVEDALGDAAAPVLRTLDEHAGLLSPAAFSEALDTAGATGAPRAAAESAFGAYRGALEDAGTRFSYKMYINYRDTTNADDVVKYLFGFHVFATRSLPFYAETLATHPLLLKAVLDFKTEREQRAKAGGYSKNRRRLYGVELPVPEDLVSGLFGPAGQVFLDPTSYSSVVQGAMNALQDSPDAKGTPFLGTMLNTLQRVGLQPGPWLQVPLEVAGAYGGQQPQNLLRLEPLVEGAAQAITGQPVEAPWKTLQRARIGPLADRDPNSPDMRVRLRLREMSLENEPAYAAAHPTAPIAQRYRNAMVNGAADPLWQQAMRDLGRQKAIESATSFVGVPLTFQGRTGAGIDQVLATLPPVNATGGGKPFEPVVPNPGVAPGTPLETPALHRRREYALALSGRPEAAASGPAFHRNPGEAGGASSAHAGGSLADAIVRDYQSADPQRKSALMQNPVYAPTILNYLGSQAHLRPQRLNY